MSTHHWIILSKPSNAYKRASSARYREDLGSHWSRPLFLMGDIEMGLSETSCTRNLRQQVQLPSPLFLLNVWTDSANRLWFEISDDEHGSRVLESLSWLIKHLDDLWVMEVLMIGNISFVAALCWEAMSIPRATVGKVNPTTKISLRTQYNVLVITTVQCWKIPRNIHRRQTHWYRVIYVRILQRSRHL